jgi:His/Glu/Gln/Arg/opine family amino acid ABC transporter permease subunit
MNFLDLDSVLYIVEGVGITLKFTISAFILGILLAFILTMMKMSNWKILNIFSIFYISIFRGTPLLVQLSIFYFSIPGLIGYQISAFEAGIIAFSFNSAAYVSEILRLGLKSVDKGQYEAAKSLSIPYQLMMVKIIMPQALRISLPALANEFVNLLKETAIISVIGVPDLMRRAQVISSEKYIYFEPLLIAAICYYVIVVIFGSLAKYLEYRLR